MSYYTNGLKINAKTSHSLLPLQRDVVFSAAEQKCNVKGILHAAVFVLQSKLFAFPCSMNPNMPVLHSHIRFADQGKSLTVVDSQVAHALESDLGVIACIGEKLEEREAGTTEEVVYAQTQVIAGKQRKWQYVCKCFTFLLILKLKTIILCFYLIFLWFYFVLFVSCFSHVNRFVSFSCKCFYY